MIIRHYPRKFTVILITLMMVTCPLWAQEEEEVGLEEMLDQIVITPSQTGKKISQSPAIISVISGSELEALGVNSLYEAISYLPGVEVMETSYGYTAVQFRGILQQHYNNKVALLLNGQPLYDQIVSSFYLEQIPISAIDKLEVIRGPGGVLYGTNAYAGVINIITQKGEKLNGAKTSLKAGKFATIASDLKAGRKIDELDMFFAAGFNESDGYSRTVQYDEDDSTLGGWYGHSSGKSRTMGFYSDDPDAYEDDYKNLFGSITYRDLTVNGVYFDNQKDKLGIIPTLASTGERCLKGAGFNLKYARPDFYNGLNFKGIAWYDQIDKFERVNRYNPVLRDPTGHPDDQLYNGSKYGTQMEFSYSLMSQTSLLAGAGYEHSVADKYIYWYVDSFDVSGARLRDLPAGNFDAEKTTNDLWAFLQAEISPTDPVNVTLGSRYNTNKQAGAAFVPNLGVVYSVMDNLSVKALYGAGFRNPSFFEKYVFTVNVLAGDPDLKPEKINTYELGVDYMYSKYSFRLNGFYTTTGDLIGRTALTAADTAIYNHRTDYGTGNMLWSKGAKYINIEGVSYQGVEFEIKGRPFNLVNFFANVSYKTGKDNNDNELLFFAPLLGNASVTVSPKSWLSFTGSSQYIGERKGHYKPLYVWNRWTEADYTLPSYILANLTLTIKPTENLSLLLQGNNLLDEVYEYPEYIRMGIPSIPGGPGRAFYLKLVCTL
jgi:outer membrane receptor protein involved in Fe transport